MSTHMASGASYCTDALKARSYQTIADLCHTSPTILSWGSQLAKLPIVLSSARCPYSQMNNWTLFSVGKKYRLLTQETTREDSSFKESKHHWTTSHYSQYLTLGFSCFLLGMIIFHLQPRLGTNKVGIRSRESSVQTSFPFTSRN